MPDLIGVRVAPPRTRNQIRKYAYQLRKDLGLLETENFPIMHILEHVIPVIHPGFYLEPVEDQELQGRMAETVPEQGVIRVKESVYQAACSGNAWARMIMAHELGHFLFHNSQNTAYAYMEKGSRLPSDVDPERQADIFAAELLIPLHLICDKNVYQVQKHFGVSRSAAKTQMMYATKVRKRHEHKTHIKEKRPSPEKLNR